MPSLLAAGAGTGRAAARERLPGEVQLQEQEAVQEIGHDQKIDYIDELVNEQLKIETKVQGEDI